MVYTVTVLHINEIKKEIIRTRCWGYFFNLADAFASVEQNHTNIFEHGYYTHAVIEIEEPDFLRKYVRFCFG